MVLSVVVNTVAHCTADAAAATQRSLQQANAALVTCMRMLCMLCQVKYRLDARCEHILMAAIFPAPLQATLYTPAVVANNRVGEELIRALVPCSTGPTDLLDGWLQRAEVAARALVQGRAGSTTDEGEGGRPLPADTSALQAALVALAEHLQVCVCGSGRTRQDCVWYRRARRWHCRCARLRCRKRSSGLRRSLCLLARSRINTVDTQI